MDDPRVLSIVIAVLGLILNVGALVVGSVWAIGKINAQVAVFTESIRALRETISGLQRVVVETDKRVDRHEVEIAKLKQHLDHIPRVIAPQGFDPPRT